MRLIADCKFMKNTVVLQTKYPVNLEDGEYSVEITEIEKDKTRRQVNYFWALIREIAKNEDGNAMDVERWYGLMLKRANIKVQGFWIKDEALDDFKRLVGHFVVLEKNKGFSKVEVYIGISQMNVKEMMSLIDTTIEYAEMLKIPTSYWKEVLK